MDEIVKYEVDNRQLEYALITLKKYEEFMVITKDGDKIISIIIQGSEYDLDPIIYRCNQLNIILTPINE